MAVVAGRQATLRADVRRLVSSWSVQPCMDSWMRAFDPEFSRALGGAGWIGMSWPVAAGGLGRSNVDRLAMTEELLRAGAPVSAHWTADRQIGPALVRNGPAELCAELLPAIRRGEVVVGLGLSETEAGSDLAAVRTRAVPDGDGWRIDGAKVWTTSAHHATHLYVLARTDEGASRHEGLTEFLVDADSPGITIRPILDLVGEHHFNEVLLDGVRVPGTRVLGAVGQGWTQVTEQLGFERGGAERYLSTYPLMVAMVRCARAAPDRAAVERIGALTARLVAVRELGVQVARTMDDGAAPPQTASELKLVGTAFEKEVVETARYVLDVCGTDDEAQRLLVDGTAAVPGASIRGGASEIMRTILGRAPSRPAGFRAELRPIVDDVLGGGNDPRRLWRTVVELGWPGVGTPEEVGGSGGDLGDVAELAAGIGRHAHELPLIDTGLAMWTAAAAGLPVDPVRAGSVLVQARAEDLVLHEENGTLRLAGTVSGVRVPADLPFLVVAESAGCTRVAVVPAAAVDIDALPTLTDEPTGRLAFSDVGVEPGSWAPAPADLAARVRDRAAVLAAAALTGAMVRACVLTREHVAARRQFGRALGDHQAVQHLLADAEVERDVALAAVAVALARPTTATAAAAKTTASRSAGVVATVAHQLHGAIGITREHALHTVTTRLWSWRDEGGTQREHEGRLGAAVLAHRPGELVDAALWAVVTGAE